VEPLGCLVPPTLLTPPLVNGSAVAAVLTAVVVSDSWLLRRIAPSIAPLGPRKRNPVETISVDPAPWEKFADVVVRDRDRGALLSQFVKWYLRQPWASLPPRA